MVWKQGQIVISDGGEGEPLGDEQILARAKNNPAEFAPLYQRYFPRIYSYCLRRVGRQAEAEDLTSLIFTRALANLESFRGGSVAAWLFQIAHNAVANYWRGRKPHVSLDSEILPLVEQLPDENDDTLEQILKVEERQIIARLIAALPDDQRELILLKVVGRLTAKEIGTILGKREGTIRVAIYRIMQQLRHNYQQQERNNSND